MKITIDNVARRNSFTPATISERSDALTELDQNENYWAALAARFRLSDPAVPVCASVLPVCGRLV